MKHYHMPLTESKIDDRATSIVTSRAWVVKMATSLKHEAFHKNLECPVCLSFFKEPKILTCSHTFCKGCLETLLESRGKLLCPTCREETSVPGRDVGRLQSNITVRSLVEDVETQVQVCTNSNQENKSLPRKRNKCRKHPNNDEECFCLNCNKYVCSMCGILEHAKDAHTILEAGAYETDQKNHIEKLASKADAKIRNVDKYFTFIDDQRKRLHNIQEQLNDEIDATFEESVEKLKERKRVLKNEIGHKLGKLKTSLGDVEKPIRNQIDDIKKVLDLVKNGLNFPLQTEALTSHKVMCQQLEGLLNRITPDEELLRRTVEEGERISFRSQGSEGLKLGHIRQKNSKAWVLRTEVPLPAGKSISGMVISPNNEMAVSCLQGGIVIYSSDGTIQDTVLRSVGVIALHFIPDGGYVIRDTYTRWSLCTELCEKLDGTFGETMVFFEGGFEGFAVSKDGLIFIGNCVCKKIHVFKPEGGKAIREIKCNGCVPYQIFAMTSNQAMVVKGFCYSSRQDLVQVINDVSGAIIHSIRKDGYDPYPAVCQDDSIIIAWVEHDQGLMSIVQYTKELKYIKNILTDFKITKSNKRNFFLQAFKTGEIAFCTHNSLYIFHKTWE